MSKEESTVGWDAIDQALVAVYGEQEPKHFGTILSYELGGNDPLDGISVYKAETPVPHWHFITYGFSELYEKELEDPEQSGYGFELTFRLIREIDEMEPPAWALNLLQNMGRYVFNSGNVFRNGDYLDANGPICLGADTLLTALAFITDPQLNSIDTPNGHVQFLQMVGITNDELEAMQTWNTLGVLASGEAQIPCYVTDLNRKSLLSDASIAEAVQSGMELEGSNTGILFVDQLGWTTAKKGLFRKPVSTLTLGAKQAEIIGKLLQGRLLKDKELTLAGPNVTIQLKPMEQTTFVSEGNSIKLFLDERTVKELSKLLQPKERSFKVASADWLSVEVLKTTITDDEGTVVKVIG